MLWQIYLASLSASVLMAFTEGQSYADGTLWSEFDSESLKPTIFSNGVGLSRWSWISSYRWIMLLKMTNMVDIERTKNVAEWTESYSSENGNNLLPLSSSEGLWTVEDMAQYEDPGILSLTLDCKDCIFLALDMQPLRTGLAQISRVESLTLDSIKSVSSSSAGISVSISMSSSNWVGGWPVTTPRHSAVVNVGDRRLLRASRVCPGS